MASSVTLGSLKLQARERADMVNSKFIDDAELTRFINGSIKELYDWLVNAGEFYYIATQTINITSGADSYPLASDFYKLLGVDLVVDTLGNGVTLKPFQFEQRNSYLFTPTWNVVGLSYLRYMLQGNNIKFVPVPSGANECKLFYAPAFQNLTTDSATFDGINGWEEFVVLDAAIKMLAKEESDVSVLAAQRGAMLQRIEDMKVMRDIGSPSRVGDSSRTMPWEFWSFGGTS